MLNQRRTPSCPSVLISRLVHVCIAVAASAQTPGFYLVGETSGANESEVLAISYDGTLAVGYTGRPSFVERAYRWTTETGRVDAGDPDLLPFSSFTGLSDDGTVIAGYMYPSVTGANLQAFVRYPGQPLTILPRLSGYSKASSPTRVSGNGMVLAGVCQGSGTPPPMRCFRWTPTGGIQALPYARTGDTLALLFDISSDGTTIVGYSASPSGGSAAAFKWRAQTGTIVLAAPGTHAEAHGVSSDGSIVVGSYATSGGSRAVYWDSQLQMHDLGAINGSAYQVANCVSDDGRVIGGNAGGVSGFTRQAFVWTSELGMRSAIEHFNERGVALPSGYTSYECSSISGDGRVFGVRVFPPGGGPANISGVAVLGLPCCADFNKDGGVDGSDVEAFFGPWTNGLTSADVNEDGGVDGADVEVFFLSWEAGGC